MVLHADSDQLIHGEPRGAFLTIEKAVTPFKDVNELANSKGISYGSYASGSTKKFFEVRPDSDTALQ